MQKHLLRFSRFCIVLSVGLVSNTSALAQSIAPERITIARDAWGVPHVFAKTDPEVAYGLAWAHAEDDFKTIQQVFLPTKGLLGKHLGKSGAAIDYVVALIRARDLASTQYPAQFSAEYRAVLEAYVAGLNAYARAHPAEVLVKRSFPISPEDVITGFALSNASFAGIDRAIKGILEGTTPAAPQVGGSNALAISAKRTADGQTYLAINSHQPLEGPVAWYEAHLCSEEGWNILGGLFPGAATVLHGCNENLAWAHTVNYHDKMDVYELEINPANKLQYKWDGNWKNLEVRKVKLRIKGIPFAIAKKAYWSAYGPTMKGKNGTFSMRYSGMFEVRNPEQWYRMNKARNFSEFYKALEMTAIPGGFNIIYADRNDTIFYVTNGKIPLRKPQFDWKGTLPGNTSQTRWTDFHPLKDLPQLVSPPSGYLFNTNNTPYNATAPADNLNPARYDATMGIETFELNRSVRMGELMQQYAGTINYDDFKRIKYDQQLPRQLSYLTDPKVLFELSATSYPDIAPLIEQLKNWNRKATTDNTTASVFVLTYNYLRQKVNAFRPVTEAEAVEALRHAKEHLMRYFGTLNVPLGELQRHTRGTVSLPCSGMPDVLAAMDAKPAENGRLRAAQGESYIELVRFTKNGLPQIESVNAYGASNKPNSPHYTDQMELFVQQKTKKMSLDKATVLKEATRTYHPQ
jgi:acyl-homoserine-lactone acylase